ncbi:MAG: hypothetical protein QOK43_955 [Acidimicrobiaceae bacterium]|nr:hypothetical protein [Acidimicrobiaceae bacterium]
MDELSDDLAAWEGAGARARERSLRRQAEQSATLAGVLLDLAERGSDVAVRVVGAAGLRAGRISAVGTDFFVLGPCYIPMAAVASVRASDGTTVSGGRVVPQDSMVTLTLASALAELAEERPPVSIALDGGDAVQGELRAVGDGVLSIGSDQWVALDAVRVLTLV